MIGFCRRQNKFKFFLVLPAPWGLPPQVVAASSIHPRVASLAALRQFTFSLASALREPAKIQSSLIPLRLLFPKKSADFSGTL
jgi:hypothetical protein